MKQTTTKNGKYSGERDGMQTDAAATEVTMVVNSKSKINITAVRLSYSIPGHILKGF